MAPASTSESESAPVPAPEPAPASTPEPAPAPEPFVFLTAKKKPAQLPSTQGELFADTHTHLAMLDDPALALARAAYVGMGLVVTLASVHEDAAATYDNVDAWRADAAALLEAHGHAQPVPQVRVIVGSHPHDAKDYTPAAEEEIRAWAKHPLTVGIGEVGLDYYYDISPRDEQVRAFYAQMELAQELNLPVSLHIRDAHAQAAQILSDTGLPKAGAILHCFNRAPQTMQPFVEMGCYVSFAGPLTFKKSDDVREAAAQVPRHLLLTETDAPFMAPEPCRGPGNEPAYTLFTLAELARVCGDSAPSMARLTCENALRLFSL